MSVYKSEKVIDQHINGSDFRVYTLGYESESPREEAFISLLIEAIPEFAFGIESGDIAQTQIIARVREAAKSIYGNRTTNGGELGEAILHLLLRDYFGTVPLISGIYFKDSDEQQVHGFDAIHVSEGEKKRIWLGESKFYSDKSDGTRELAQSVVEHFEKSYLRRQFALISKKLPVAVESREYWLDILNGKTSLDNIFDVVSIPCLCTYDCNVYATHKEASEIFLKDINLECNKLKESFTAKTGKVPTDIEIHLLLFPIPSKDEFLRLFIEKIDAMASI
jgi:hypothetical protein